MDKEKGRKALGPLKVARDSLSSGQYVDAAGPGFQSCCEPAQHVGQTDLGIRDLSLACLPSQVRGHLCEDALA